jgi:hypothetical protein
MRAGKPVGQFSPPGQGLRLRRGKARQDIVPAGRRGREPAPKQDAFASREPALLRRRRPTVKNVTILVADRELDWRHFSLARADVGDLAFDAENGFGALMCRDRVEVAQLKSAQIDRQAERRIGGAGRRAKPHDLAAKADDRHAGCQQSRAGAKIFQEGYEPARPGGRSRLHRFCDRLDAAFFKWTFQNDVLRGKLDCGGAVRPDSIGRTRDEPNHIAARAGDAAPIRTERGFDNVVGFGAAGAIDQHDSAKPALSRKSGTTQ